jgi:hypothetical protein
VCFIYFFQRLDILSTYLNIKKETKKSERELKKDPAPNNSLSRRFQMRRIISLALAVCEADRRPALAQISKAFYLVRGINSGLSLTVSGPNELDSPVYLLIFV